MSGKNELEILLEQQVSQTAALLHRHELEMLTHLTKHRHKLTELALASTLALQEEVLGGMQRWLQGIITEEAGLADAEDARPLLRIVNRMRDTIREKGKL